MSHKASNWAWEWVSQLSGKSSLILLKLADLADDEGFCHPSYNYIARMAGCERRTVIRAISDMEQRGLIAVVDRDRKRANGSYTSNVYCLQLKTLPSDKKSLGVVTKSHHLVTSDVTTPSDIAVSPLYDPSVRTVSDKNTLSDLETSDGDTGFDDVSDLIHEGRDPYLSEPKKTKAQQAADFEYFWQKLDRWHGPKGNKREAQTAFFAINPTVEQLVDMLSAYQRQVAHVERMQALNQFAAQFKHVCRWLKNECWNDDLNNGSLMHENRSANFAEPRRAASPIERRLAAQAVRAHAANAGATVEQNDFDVRAPLDVEFRRVYGP